eukprot:2064154-Amphidinium_carterae.1
MDVVRHLRLPDESVRISKPYNHQLLYMRSDLRRCELWYCRWVETDVTAPNNCLSNCRKGHSGHDRMLGLSVVVLRSRDQGHSQQVHLELVDEAPQHANDM